MMPWRPAMTFWSIVGQAILQTAGTIGPSTSVRSKVFRPGASGAGIAVAAATAPSPAGTPSAPRIAPESEMLVIEGSVSSSSSEFQSRRKVLRRPGETDRGGPRFRHREAGKVLAAEKIEVNTMAERHKHPDTDEEALAAAKEDAREGKSPTTQAGEFVREEMHHVREGKHGARSTKQAIAIGLSQARRKGVAPPPPKKVTASARTRKSAARDRARGRRGVSKVSPKRSRATKKALRREGRSAASKRALARQARSTARRRGAAARSRAAKKAARTRARRKR